MTTKHDANFAKFSLLATFILCILSCFLYAKTCSRYAYSLYKANSEYRYLEWVKPWLCHEKPFELMWFCLSFALLYLCLFAWMFIYRYAFDPDERKILNFGGVAVLSSGICLACVWILSNSKSGGIAAVVITTVMWMMTFLLPVFYLSRRYSWTPRLNPFSRPVDFKKPLLALFLIVFALFSYDIVRLLGDDFALGNEFVEFSEKTVIDGKAHDNIAFFKDRLRYDNFSSVAEYIATDYEAVSSDNSFKAARSDFFENQDDLTRNFLRYNKEGFRWQLMNRSFDLHNNQTMNPLNAWLQGVPLGQTHNLYGLTIPATARLFFSVTKFSYDNWLKFAFFLQWFYFVSIPLAVYYYFRSKEIASAAFITLVGISFYGIYSGYFYLVNAQIPINPIRHGFDFLAIIAFGCYLKRKDFLSLAGIFATCVCAIATGDHFGLALTAACAATLFIVFLTERRSLKEFLVLLALLVLTLFSFKFSNLSNDNNISVAYFIDGFFSWSSKKIIAKLFIAYTVLYLGLFYLYVKGKAGKEWYLTVLLTLYSNMLCFHYVWHGVRVHLGISMTINCILIVCYTKILFEHFKIERWIVPVLFTLSVTAFGANYFKFQKTRKAYYTDLSHHQVYQWDFDVASFRTSMPPEYFGNSIDLINRYSSADAGIYMISKYDNMLSVLTRKYAKLRYPNLPYFLVTDVEVRKVIDQLKNEKPELLYVDSDVMLDGQLWTVNNYVTLSSSSLYRENKLRLSRLNELKKIFEQVSGEYTLVEKGKIIDVYRRRNL